jgi:hypothetical protein
MNILYLALRLVLCGWLLLTAIVPPASGSLAGEKNGGVPSPALLPAWFPPAPPSPRSPLDPALARALSRAGPNDILPAIVVLREQAALTPTPAASGGFPSPSPALRERGRGTGGRG